MTLKAYKIGCADGDHGQKIRFAERGRTLRGSRADDFCDCEFIDLFVKRAPKFDKYAPGPVTISQYLAEGWYWECTGCGKQLWNEDSPIIIEGHCFCDLDCVVRSRAAWPEDVSGHHESVKELCSTIDQWLSPTGATP